MPKGTRVHRQFEALKRGGKNPGSAARIAQSNTGQSLQTGKLPKHKSGHKRKK